MQNFLLNINMLDEYSSWKQNKLANLSDNIENIRVNISDPSKLTSAERSEILRHCDQMGMCFYKLSDPQKTDKSFIREMGMQIGMHTLDTNLCADKDSITSLEARDDGRQQGYIPYTRNRLNWHTDGYYNTEKQIIRGIIMHCVRPASAGGENQFLDPELLYIHLRDINPAFITALTQHDAMTIPPNIENGVAVRAAQTGPVFSIDNQSGRLHMRYTARTKSIEWKRDATLEKALLQIREFLLSDTHWILRYKLQAGEGIICNNVLHNRSAFDDSSNAKQTRLLYRARFYERVINQ